MFNLVEHRIQCLINLKIGAHEDETTWLGQPITPVKDDFDIAANFLHLQKNLLEKILFLAVYPDPPS